MSLKFTTAPTSRITKSGSRQNASPLKKNSRSSNGPTRGTGPVVRLPDTGRVVSLLRRPPGSVPVAMDMALNTMFEPIPSSGLSSTKIAKTYSARVAIPRVVTVSHVQALLGNATKTERELATLTKAGTVRKLVVPLRGMTGGGEEVLIKFTEMEDLLEKVEGPDTSAKQALLNYLRENPTSYTIPRTSFSPEEGAAFVQAGFFTLSANVVSSIMGPVDPLTAAADAGTISSLMATSIAAPAGSLAAVGGSAPVYDLGGSGGGAQRRTEHSSVSEIYHLTLPGMGSFLRLLIESRYHLVSLLGRSHGAEAPQTLLQERWDGGVSTHGRSGMKLPSVGKTRQWKDYDGLRSQWVMAECVGAGILELFDTGSVGNGVRATGKRA